MHRFYSSPRHVNQTDFGAQPALSPVGTRFVPRGYSDPTANGPLRGVGSVVCIASRLRPGDQIANPCRKYPKPSGPALAHPFTTSLGTVVVFWGKRGWSVMTTHLLRVGYGLETGLRTPVWNIRNRLDRLGPTHLPLHWVPWLFSGGKGAGAWRLLTSFE